MLNNFYPYVFYLDCLTQPVEEHTANLVEKILPINSSTQIILACYEWQTIDNLVYMLRQINEQCKGKKLVCLLTRSFYLDYVDQLKHVGVDIRFIEFDILNLYFEIYVYQTSKLNTTWNSRAEKFLFLTGKPNRSNRLPLLYNIWQRGLSEQCIWSLFMSDELRSLSRNLLADISDLQYNEFIDNCTSNPDSIDVSYGSGGSMHYDGYPFDHTLYSNTLFRLVSETQMFNQAIITEKTWTTIANRHPFMIAGYPGTARVLNRLGYKTFNEYMVHPDYDSIKNEEQRFSMLLDNVEHWLTNVDQFSDDMFNDIEHNYNLLSQELINTWKEFEEVYALLNTSKYATYQILPSPLQRAKWINFYYGVKDDSWPDCFDEKLFKTLPKDIQDECINVHGYKL